MNSKQPLMPVIVGSLILSLTTISAHPENLAQDRTSPKFEAASVRPATPSGRTAQRVTTGRVSIVNTSLRSLLLLAFGIKAPQLSGPGWIDTATFDIQATIPAGVGREEVPHMLRTLLKERFGLVERVERRLVDGYDLLVGGDGLRMREVAVIDDLGKDFGGHSDVTETLEGPSRLMTIPLGIRRVTSRSNFSTWTAADSTFHVEAERISMSEFAELLAFNMDQPVVDKTGLDGVYAFSVVLDRNASVAKVLRSLGVTSFGGRTVGDPTGASTPTVVESLGLRLKPSPVPLDFVVVDKIERKPTEN